MRSERMIYSNFVLDYAASMVMTFLIKGLTANLFEKELIEKPSKTTWSV